MSRTLMAATLAAALSGAVPALAEDRIRIASAWGEVTAVLADNAAAKALLQMLPLTLGMTDHLRQEKTGTLPAPLPSLPRQREFSAGTLGLWSADHFVIYYSGGRVPSPGIIELGRVAGDAAIFDRPGAVEVRIERLP